MQHLQSSGNLPDFPPLPDIPTTCNTPVKGAALNALISISSEEAAPLDQHMSVNITDDLKKVKPREVNNFRQELAKINGQLEKGNIDKMKPKQFEVLAQELFSIANDSFEQLASNPDFFSEEGGALKTGESFGLCDRVQNNIESSLNNIYILVQRTNNETLQKILSNHLEPFVRQNGSALSKMKGSSENDFLQERGPSTFNGAMQDRELDQSALDFLDLTLKSCGFEVDMTPQPTTDAIKSTPSDQASKKEKFAFFKLLVAQIAKTIGNLKLYMAPKEDRLKELINECMKPAQSEPLYKTYREVPLELQSAKRSEMNDLLNSCGRLKGGEKIFGKKESWTINIDKIDSKAPITMGGKFQLSPDEIKEMIQSTKVSYDANLVDDETLQKFLTKGANTHSTKESRQARGRCVGSDVVTLVNQNGETIERKLDEPLLKYRLYTMNAPNLEGTDSGQFIIDGKFSYDSYKEEMISLLTHYFTDCKEDGLEVAVLPGFGMGVYLPTKHKAEGFKAFAEALKAAQKNAGIKNVIFADPNRELCDAVRQYGGSKIQVVEKSCLDVVDAGAKREIKMGLLNPGDPRCYPGENWEGGDFAFEEMLGMYTTLVLTQHPGAAPNVRNKEAYIKREIR